MKASLLPMMGILIMGGCSCAMATVYLEPEVFVESSFEEEAQKEVIWLSARVKDSLKEILGHPYRGLRIQYWRLGTRTAWILEEIGKVEPITAGFVVEEGRLVNMAVLIYRETHGWEVRYPFFTDQFRGLEITEQLKLNDRVDGISGATLSVNALIRLARMALLLHGEVIP